MLTVNDVRFFHHPHAKTRQVVVLVQVHAGHFRGFTTY